MKLIQSYHCIIIGDNHLALECGNYWLDNGNIILAIVSSFKPAKQWAQKHGIKSFQTLAELETYPVSSHTIDYIFSIVNYRLLPDWLINSPRFYAINFHDALLPKYAGRHATSWAIFNQESTHGITWHVMEKVIDEGKIIAQTEIPLSESETALSLNVKCYEAAKSAFCQLVRRLSEGELKVNPQNLAIRTYFSLHQKMPGNGWITWEQPAEQIMALFHALDFGAYDNRLGTPKFLFEHQLYIVTNYEIDETGFGQIHPPGTIIAVQDNELRVATQTQVVLIHVTRLSGQKVIFNSSHVGLSIASPHSTHAEAVKSYSEHISPFEKFWVTELSQVASTSLPFMVDESANINFEKIKFNPKHGLKSNLIDQWLSVLILYLARLNRQSQVSVLFNSMEGKARVQEFDAFFAVNLPFTLFLDFEWTFSQLLEKVTQKRQDLLQKHTYTSDIALRYQQLAVIDLSQLVVIEISENEVETRHYYHQHRLHIIINPAHQTLSYHFPKFSSDVAVALANQIQAHVEGMLTAALTNPHFHLSKIPILTPHEYQQLQCWNDTDAYYPKQACIHDVIEQQVQKTPQHIAVIFEESTLSYHELEVRANALAQHFVDLGIGEDAIIGVFLERSLEMVIGLLAIFKSGGAYLPLDPDYPDERIAVIVGESRTQLIMTTSNLSERLNSLHVTKIWVDDWQKTQNHPPQYSRHSQQLASVIYTSGSTGVPKGVMNTHQGLVNRLWWMQDTYHLTQADRILHKTPFSFDVSIWELFWPLMFGATLVIAKPKGHRDVYYLYELIKHQNITITHFVPAMLRLFLKSLDGLCCPNLRYVFSSGEALKAETVALFYQKLSANLHNLYGPTEASIDVTYWPCPRLPVDIVLIGRPIANMKIHLLDQGLQPLPVGVPAEIYIEGPGLARGYLHREELTHEKYLICADSTRLYRTGDLGRYLPDGSIQWLNRIDHQVKLRGYRIELGEIEQVLMNQVEWVDRAVAIIKEEGSGIQQLIAFVVLVHAVPLTLSAQDIQAYLKKQLSLKLPDYMVPDRILFMDEIPLSVSGKIDVKRLSEISKFEEAPQETMINCPIQRDLVHIWSKILSVKTINLHGNFFNLGGNSLLATQMIIQVRACYPVLISLVDLFKHPTVFEFAECIQTKEVTHVPTFHKKARPEIIPITLTQQRLWLAELMITEKATYHIPLVISMTGNLCIDSLQQAFLHIRNRHEILSVNYRTNEGVPVYDLYSSSSYTLETIQVDEDESVEELIKTIIHQPFNLRSDCLLRTKLLILNPQHSILVIVLPHIVTDETSLFILLRELSHFYRSGFHLMSTTLEPLPLQFIDFALWQTEEANSSRQQTQLEYWQSFLANAPATSTFPTDHSRPEFLGQSGKTYSIKLDKDLSEQLKAISKKQQVTIFMTLTAALNILIYRYTQQTDIVIATPVNERKHKETEGLMGCFVNVVALRTQINPAMTFAGLLDSIKEMSLKAYEHSDIPLQRVISHLQLKRSYCYNPLYQVMISVQSETLALDFPGIQYEILPAFTETSKLDLTFYILTHHTDGFVINIEYSTELFHLSRVVKMARDYVQILESIANESCMI